MLVEDAGELLLGIFLQLLVYGHVGVEQLVAGFGQGGSVRAVAAVSYTHLDVYKRQVVQRTDAVSVSFDVRYELPSLAAIPGLAHCAIARHVVCELMAGRIVEVEVGA